MKLVKSLLLGSAAGFCAVAGAQAADLPARKAAPVEYVRVCTAHGAGFFFIPGTDTCLRVGGRARFDFQYNRQLTRATSTSGFFTLGRLNIDARTATPYGTLRAFVRFDIASRNGTPYINSASQTRLANSFRGDGADTYNQAQKFVNIDKAFIQFAGLTAGRAQSFYDFYAGDLEFIGAGVYSNTNTNLLAYTASFGQGFSASVSMEDPTNRRAPVFYQGLVGAANPVAGTAPAAMANGVNFVTSAVPVAFIANGFNAAGVPVSAVALDTTQRLNMPDFVGALRLDSTWGSVQLSGAVHEIRVGSFNTVPGTFAVNGGGAVATAVAPRIPDAQYGFAVQGGVKVNLPQLAPGDQLWLQGAYAQGASAYTGVFGPTGYDSLTASINNRFTTNSIDAVVDANSRVSLTESWSVMGAFLHYWKPEWRQAVFATYGQVNFDPRLRTVAGGPAGITGSAAVGAVNPFNPTLMSYDVFYGGSNLIWSPVRDLDIGVEVVYYRLDPARRVADANRGGIAPIGGTTVTGTGRTVTKDDNVMARFRVQRDF